MHSHIRPGSCPPASGLFMPGSPFFVIKEACTGLPLPSRSSARPGPAPLAPDRGHLGSPPLPRSPARLGLLVPVPGAARSDAISSANAALQNTKMPVFGLEPNTLA